MEIQVIPGLLEHDQDEFERKLLQLSKFSDKVFVDIIDGRFVENVTIGMDELMETASELEFYVHLMTEEPIEYLHQCAEAGTKLVATQVELMENQMEVVEKGNKLGMKVVLGLDLPTPIDFLETEALEKSEGVMLLAVKAGKSEQKFDRQVLKKIETLRESGFEKDIFVDGGVNVDTIKECVRAGANAFSVTSGILKAKSMEKAYQDLVRLAESVVKG